MARIVIGVGNDLRGDDAAGWEAVRRLVPSPSLVLHEHGGDAPGLISLWGPDDDVVVVDAVVSSDPPGTIVEIDALAAPLPADVSWATTHGAGVAEGIELARVLGTAAEEPRRHRDLGEAVRAGSADDPGRRARRGRGRAEAAGVGDGAPEHRGTGAPSCPRDIVDSSGGRARPGTSLRRLLRAADPRPRPLRPGGAPARTPRFARQTARGLHPRPVLADASGSPAVLGVASETHRPSRGRRESISCNRGLASGNRPDAGLTCSETPRRCTDDRPSDDVVPRGGHPLRRVLGARRDRRRRRDARCWRGRQTTRHAGGMLGSLGPATFGNEFWLVAGVAALFAAFPAGARRLCMSAFASLLGLLVLMLVMRAAALGAGQSLRSRRPVAGRRLRRPERLAAFIPGLDPREHPPRSAARRGGPLLPARRRISSDPSL